MSNRTDIYYWKCDRPNAFFAIDRNGHEDSASFRNMVRECISELFHTSVELQPSCGQGNHLTYLVEYNGCKYFVRIENGTDGDDYMEVESRIISEVGRTGIPVPKIYAVDSSRSKYPFAYQLMEYLEYKDMNKLYSKGMLDTKNIMEQLGTYIASWQSLSFPGFGPFNAEKLRSKNALEGLHADYPSYYRLNLKHHLNFLTERGFISKAKEDEILSLVKENESLLEMNRGCLVHKDIALWNVLGDSNRIKCVIDWDDAIIGDPVDDISLMACFHSWDELKYLVRGYENVRPLPDNFEKRFWLHLLRNILFKAVIRVGAGYFDRNEGFFLTASDSDLKNTTIGRIEAACRGLRDEMKIEEL